MASQPALGRAIITNDLSMPDLVDGVANFIRVWPLVVPYLKKTGRKGDRDCLEVGSSLWVISIVTLQCIHCCFVV